MASAALSPELEVPAPAPTAAFAWWHCWHSYAFITLISFELVFTWAFVRLVESATDSSLSVGLQSAAIAALFGFVMAQTFLLGLWAALGGLATVPRWLVVGTVSSAGALVVAMQLISNDWSELIYQGPIVVVIADVMMAVFAVVLLPLRRLAGWRVDFDAAYHPSRGSRRGQMQLMDFAALFCAVALPLTLCRMLIELMGDEAAVLGFILPIFGVLILAGAAPVALAALAQRRRVLWWLGCGGWLAALCAAQFALTAWFPDLDVFDAADNGYSLAASVAGFHGSVALAIGLPLALLRRAGLKLIVVA